MALQQYYSEIHLIISRVLCPAWLSVEDDYVLETALTHHLRDRVEVSLTDKCDCQLRA